MRRLTALLLMALAVLLACVAWPVVWLCLTCRQQADRLQQGQAGQPSVPDAACWAAIRQHEAALRNGEAKWQ